MQCTQFHAKSAKNDLKPTDILKLNFCFETMGVLVCLPTSRVHHKTSRSWSLDTYIKYMVLLRALPSPRTIFGQWSVDHNKNFLIWLAIANHNDCHFKLLNRSWDAKNYKRLKWRFLFSFKCSNSGNHKMVPLIEAHSPILLWHVFFWCPFLTTHLAIRYLNIRNPRAGNSSWHLKVVSTFVCLEDSCPILVSCYWGCSALELDTYNLN